MSKMKYTLILFVLLFTSCEPEKELIAVNILESSSNEVRYEICNITNDIYLVNVDFSYITNGEKKTFTTVNYIINGGQNIKEVFTSKTVISNFKVKHINIIQ